MNRRQAHEYIIRLAASELNHHIANGSEWLNPEGASQADIHLLTHELRELVTSLDIRSANLAYRLRRAGLEPIP